MIHQVPEGSIVSSTNPSDGPPFFSFPSISSFIIPKQSLCGNLISLVPPPPPAQPSSHPSHAPTQSYRILGYPICITSPTYVRNEFIFNFCLVLSATDPDFNAYKSVVTKLAHLMLSLEEQSNFLSRDTSTPNTGKLYSLCETLISDLNNYCECMIPIDDLNTLNLKLFPTYSPPPPVKSWHVPLFTVRPESLMDENWDLTMQRIIPFINGINPVKHIALLADANLALAKACIKHLLYYNCVLLLDIFSFSAMYAPTAEFSSTIAADEDMQRECARYVNTAFAPTTSCTTAEKIENVVNSNTNLPTTDSAVAGDDIWPLTSSGKPLDGVGIIELFAALRQGQSVREWYAENSDMLANVDLRRFITFGIIKGFVYRVHKYAFAVANGAGVAPRPKKANGNLMTKGRDVRREAIDTMATRNGSHYHSYSRQDEDGAEKVDEGDEEDDTATVVDTNSTTSPSLSSSTSTHLNRKAEAKHKSMRTRRNEQPGFSSKLSHYLDGTHCFDQICTELEISEAELETRLRAWSLDKNGDREKVLIIHR